MKQIGYERGSVLDLALITGGSLDCIISVGLRNDVCISDDMVNGREYETDYLEGRNNEYKLVIDTEHIRPATALNPREISACPYGGIGFMGIEIDFEVS